MTSIAEYVYTKIEDERGEQAEQTLTLKTPICDISDEKHLCE